MKTILVGLALLVLAAWLWLVASLATPAPRVFVWTVAPATTAPLSRVLLTVSKTPRCFECLGVLSSGAVGEGYR